MSTDAKDVTRRFYEEIINQKNVDAIDRFCTADFVDHNPPPGGTGSLDATRQQFLELTAAFPDLKMIVQDQIAENVAILSKHRTSRAVWTSVKNNGSLATLVHRAPRAAR